MTEQTIRTHQLKIKAAWQKAVSSSIETGQLLIKAKAALEHGEWGKLFEGDDKLPFGQDTSGRLMKIARNPVLINSDFNRNLPPSWQTLYALTQLTQRQLERAIADGTITAETTQEEAIALVRPGRRTTGDPRPAAIADQEPQSDFDLLMKVAEINRRLTLVPPSENDDLKDGLERYHREHLFEPPGFITGKFARAAAFYSEIEQMSRRAELKARNAEVEVATHGSDAPVVRIVQTLEASETEQIFASGSRC